MANHTRFELLRLLTKDDIRKWSENDVNTFIACLKYDADTLNNIEFHPRLIIDALKNLPDELDFLFTTLPDVALNDPASYYFYDIIDVKTFDIYHKHGMEFWALVECDLPEDQLEYIYSQGYIDIRTYNRGKYGSEIFDEMEYYGLTYEENLERKRKEEDEYAL